MPDLAKKRARVVGTGRSDFPNQVNNVVAFPGIFRGALEGHAKQITDKMKLAAANAIAALVSDEELNENNIMPEAFDPQLRTLLQMQSRKTSADLWHQKPYYSLDAWCKNTYGRKLYKAALDIGCAPVPTGMAPSIQRLHFSALQAGSGDFAASGSFCNRSVKSGQGTSVLQMDTGTRQAVSDRLFSGHIPTLMVIRTDCFPVMKKHFPPRRSQAFPLRRARIVFPISFWRDLTAYQLLYPDRFIWIELGLQSIHDHTAARDPPGDIRPPYFMMLQQSSMPEGFPLSSI